ncbi:hypothetical protein GCM10025875_22500 [Litorihabitans aurantiacus]|uniref:YjeF N-terminal domain-containing protein n=1 Tax=Litorihabitans aurantiacus TaxID=1930061 RepID=A0AA38CQD1_9MICO|nr:hypothetical protein GCM10025875_22500 [Litorihabitans aurantiacus]
MLTAHRSTDVTAAEAPLLAAGRPLMATAVRALSTAVARHLRQERGRVAGARVVALVGSGDNGADALLSAAELAGRGVEVTALLVGSRVHEGAAVAARRAGITPLTLPPEADADADPGSDWAARAAAADVVLDGVTGIGAHGPLRGGARTAVVALIEAIEVRTAAGGTRPHVVAVDVPSGAGVDDGEVHGPVLAADATLTTGTAKPGLLLPRPRCWLDGSRSSTWAWTSRQSPLPSSDSRPATPPRSGASPARTTTSTRAACSACWRDRSATPGRLCSRRRRRRRWSGWCATRGRTRWRTPCSRGTPRWSPGPVACRRG